MNDDERRKLETSLIRAGFKGINDPELVPEFARLITNHDIFRALLNDCSLLERRAMYNAVKPYLPFEPMSVEAYEEWSLRKLEGFQEDRKDKIAEHGEWEAIAKDMTHPCIVKLRCCQCKAAAQYCGDGLWAAVILARQAGWVHVQGELNKEICPKCPAATRSKRRKCPTCKNRHYAPNCRVIGAVVAVNPNSAQIQAPALVGFAKRPKAEIGHPMILGDMRPN